MISKIFRAIAYRLNPRHFPFFLQRMVLRPELRERIATRLAKRLPRFECTPDDVESEAGARELMTRGMTFVSELVTPEQIREIHDWLNGRPLYDRFCERRAGFVVDSIPRETHVAPYYDRDIVRCPHILRIANDARVLAIVGRVLGCAPTISNLSIWWSVGDGTPQAAEYFHRDVDDWRFVKLFVYLTDVDEQTGPHVYVEGTHRVASLLRIRRYRDEEVETAFPECPVRKYCAPAGTAFLENTFGMHKGQPVSRGRRLLLQVQYSMHRISTYAYSPLPRQGIQQEFDPYINRLFLSPDAGAS